MMMVLVVWVLAPSVVRLQRSVEQEQMVAVAPPPSSLVLQPLGVAGPPHSLVSRDTSWKWPLVTRQVWEEGGQVSRQAGCGLKWSQWSREEL